MTAVQSDRFGGPEALDYVDLPDRRPGPGEVLIQTNCLKWVGSRSQALGASPVIGTAGTEERRSFVMELCADAAIGYDEPDWPARVLELTGGRGVDVLIEIIGGSITPKVDAVLPLGLAAEAHRRLEARSVRGVIVLDPTAQRGVDA